jgi:hypothetical protein
LELVGVGGAIHVDELGLEVGKRLGREVDVPALSLLMR